MVSRHKYPAGLNLGHDFGLYAALMRHPFSICCLKCSNPLLIIVVYVFFQGLVFEALTGPFHVAHSTGHCNPIWISHCIHPLFIMT